ncbi:MAG TPA: hypothetical protein VGJ05_18425 [Fimbriiglobus sp.]
MRLHTFEEPRPAFQFSYLGNDKRLLGLPDLAGRVVVRRKGDRGAGRDRFLGLQDVKPHGAGCRVMEDQGEIVEGYYPLKLPGDVVE